MEEKKLKKFITKLKKVLNTAGKYKINSPCLLQFFEHKKSGDVEIVLSYRDVSRKFNYIKALSIATRNEFHIVNGADEEMKTLFHIDSDTSYYSPQLVISTKDVYELSNDIDNYVMSESFYCFIKVVLKLISNEMLYDVTFSYNSITKLNDVLFKFDETVSYLYTTPFIRNVRKLDNLFRMRVFPFAESTGSIRDMVVRRYEDSVNVLKFDADYIKELLEQNSSNMLIDLNYGDVDVTLYHVDFIRINPIKMEIVKKYLGMKIGGNDIVRIILSMCTKDINVILEYRYMEEEKI